MSGYKKAESSSSKHFLGALAKQLFSFLLLFFFFLVELSYMRILAYTTLRTKNVCLSDRSHDSSRNEMQS